MDKGGSSTGKNSELSRSISRLKILVLGASNVGKTSLLLRFTMDEFREETRSTIGVDFKYKDLLIGDTHFAQCQIWDTAGQERFSPVSKEYYRGSHGCALVYDITDRESFDGPRGIEYWLDELRRFIKDEEKTIDGRQKFPIVLIGNKKDQEHLRVVSAAEGIALAKKHGFSFFESSAKEGEHVTEAFTELVTEIVEDIRRKQHRSSRGSSEIDGEEPLSVSGFEKVELEKPKSREPEIKDEWWGCCSR